MTVVVINWRKNNAIFDRTISWIVYENRSVNEHVFFNNQMINLKQITKTYLFTFKKFQVLGRPVLVYGDNSWKKQKQNATRSKSKAASLFHRGSAKPWRWAKKNSTIISGSDTPKPDNRRLFPTHQSIAFNVHGAEKMTCSSGFCRTEINLQNSFSTNRPVCVLLFC